MCYSFNPFYLLNSKIFLRFLKFVFIIYNCFSIVILIEQFLMRIWFRFPPAVHGLFILAFTNAFLIKAFISKLKNNIQSKLV